MEFLTNNHFQYSYFDSVCLPQQLHKKVQKMPKFENFTALSWLTCDNSLKHGLLDLWRLGNRENLEI